MKATLETSAKRESRREEILAAAIRCFAARGFEGTSTREIAREAQVKQPLIFYHFGNKADLYLASVLDQIERLNEGLELALGDAEGTLERLRRFVEVYCHYFTVQEPGLTVCLRELNGLPGNLADQISQAHHARTTGVLEQIINDGIERGLFRRFDAGACAIAVIGILHIYLRARPATRQRYAADAPIQQVLDIYCAGLLAQPSPSQAAAFRREQRSGSPANTVFAAQHRQTS